MISIKICAYNKHTAGPLRTLVFHIHGKSCATGRDDQFAHASDHAHSIILGLRALEPSTDFTVRAIDTDAPGAGTTIDGVDLHDIQFQQDIGRSKAAQIKEINTQSSA